MRDRAKTSNIAISTGCRGGLPSRFAADQRGAVAMIFGVMILVLAGVIALGLDVTRAYGVRAQLQAASDAAALASNPTGSLTWTEAQAKAEAHFKYNTSKDRFGFENVVVTSTALTNGVKVSATADVPTTIGRVLGVNTLKVGVTSEVVAALGAVEIALALDNTFSMFGSKIGNLKTAAKGLVDKVTANSQAGTVKFALVPFSNYVNVGMKYRNAPWMSVPNDTTVKANQCWWDQKYKDCITTSATCYNDGVPFSCSNTSCTPDGPAVYTCAEQTYLTTWSGCAGSRLPKDVTALANSSSPIPGIMNVGCPNALARLTDDANAIKGQIDGMFPQGETYIPAGLIWGWRVLSSETPFADGALASANPPVRKIMILMTDGENTRSANPDSSHEGGDGAAANALMAQVCTNAKADKIEIYTVAFAVTNPTAKSLLEKCATDGAHYFDAANSAALEEAFAAIAGNLIKLALSK